LLGLLLSLLLGLEAMGASSPAVAQAPQRQAPVADDAAGPAEAAAVPTELTPLIADFDGDHRSDVFWYGPGAAPDVFWSGQAGGRFAGKAMTVGGDYQPFTGDFNGDGRRDIFWYAPGTGGDAVWYGRADGTFAGTSRTITPTYTPSVGDFGDDGRSDIFWYAPGGPDDMLWFGQPAGRFSARATTIDIGHTRAVPLRQETFASRYDPYGFVAHAFGAIDGHTYTNSLEAFRRNYGRGFRVFESTWSGSRTARRCSPTTAWRRTTA
jgi:hypothetical protein